MKNLPLILVAVLWGGVAVSELRASLDVKLTIEPISDESATAHEFTVSYSASLGLEADSLGDDDIIIGKGSLFDPQLLENAFYPELVGVSTELDSDPIIATYRIDRPEGGWGRWELGNLDVSIASNGLRYGDGQFFARTSLGELLIELESVPEMSVRVPRYPIIQGDDAECEEFGVDFRTNFPINVDILGQGEIGGLRRSATDSVFESEGRVFAVPRYFGPRLPATVVSVDASEDRTEVKVEYRIARPEDGWGEGSTMSLWLDRRELGENNRGDCSKSSRLKMMDARSPRRMRWIDPPRDGFILLESSG